MDATRAGGGLSSVQGRAAEVGLTRGSGINVREISQSVADDGTIALAAPTSGRLGVLRVDAGGEYAEAQIASDGTVTLGANVSSNAVATDTDAKLCVYNASGTPTIKQRLGAAKWVIATYRWA